MKSLFCMSFTKLTRCGYAYNIEFNPVRLHKHPMRIGEFEFRCPLPVADSQYFRVRYSRIARATDVNTSGSMANGPRPEGLNPNAH